MVGGAAPELPSTRPERRRRLAGRPVPGSRSGFHSCPRSSTVREAPFELGEETADGAPELRRIGSGPVSDPVDPAVVVVDQPGLRSAGRGDQPGELVQPAGETLPRHLLGSAGERVVERRGRELGRGHRDRPDPAGGKTLVQGLPGEQGAARKIEPVPPLVPPPVRRGGARSSPRPRARTGTTRRFRSPPGSGRSAGRRRERRWWTERGRSAWRRSRRERSGRGPGCSPRTARRNASRRRPRRGRRRYPAGGPARAPSASGGRVRGVRLAGERRLEGPRDAREAVRTVERTDLVGGRRRRPRPRRRTAGSACARAFAGFLSPSSEVRTPTSWMERWWARVRIPVSQNPRRTQRRARSPVRA